MPERRRWAPTSIARARTATPSATTASVEVLLGPRSTTAAYDQWPFRRADVPAGGRLPQRRTAGYVSGGQRLAQTGRTEQAWPAASEVALPGPVSYTHLRAHETV